MTLSLARAPLWLLWVAANDVTLTVRFLDLIKPFSPFLPEVSSPETKVPFNQKLMYVRSPNGGFRVTNAEKVDGLDLDDIPGHVPNATVWNRV